MRVGKKGGKGVETSFYALKNRLNVICDSDDVMYGPLIHLDRYLLDIVTIDA